MLFEKKKVTKKLTNHCNCSGNVREMKMQWVSWAEEAQSFIGICLVRYFHFEH